MYHYVRPRDPLLSDGVIGPTPEGFARQIEGLCRVMEPIDWPTLFAWTEGRAGIPRRCFLLTFDDGLKDHAQYVAPLLAKHRIRGAFFVPGQAIGEYRLICGHAVHLLLSRLDAEGLFEETARALAAADKPSWVGRIDERAAIELYPYETRARARLKYLLHMVLPPALRRETIALLFEAHVGSSRRWAKEWYMGWEDLADLHHAGHTIGGHGYAHDPLSRLSPEAQRGDLGRSLGLLNEGLGRDLRPVAYPFGRYDARTMIAAHEAGFVHGFTTERALVDASADAFALPRVDTIDVGEALRSMGLDEGAPASVGAAARGS